MLCYIIVLAHICVYIVNQKYVLGTHHASAHDGSSELIAEMLDHIIFTQNVSMNVCSAVIMHFDTSCMSMTMLHLLHHQKETCLHTSLPAYMPRFL